MAWFEHAHATFALGAAGNWGWGWGPTAAGTDASALGSCQANGGGSNCQPLARAVTDAPSAAGTGSSLDGRTCMISAPAGAGHLGHVGWAFLVDWRTGMWMYGANEGTVSSADATSKTWSGEGYWANLASTFAGALDGPGGLAYYHPAGYYTNYRCESLSVNDSSAATNVFIGLQDKPYSLLSNDCLTNAVDVLRADAATGLNASDTAPNLSGAPNLYYLFDMPDFEPPRPI